MPWSNPWYEYDRPKSSPRSIKDGIKARSQKGKFGETWWSERWVEVLESFDIGARLGRGRSYARRGQVMNLDIEPGKVSAKVQGSMQKPYSVVVKLAPLSPEQWGKVVEVMASQAIFAAKLLAGEMPKDIEDAFREADIPLFPSVDSDLDTDCTCPDWSNPCKHIAAVYLLLAEEFDREPFMLFRLRGMEKDHLIAALRQRRIEDPEDEAPEEQSFTVEAMTEVEAPPLESILDRFWTAGAGLDILRVTIGPPITPHATLKRLGPPHFWQGKKGPMEILTVAYDAATAEALHLAFGDQEDNGGT